MVSGDTPTSPQYPERASASSNQGHTEEPLGAEGRPFLLCSDDEVALLSEQALPLDAALQRYKCSLEAAAEQAENGLSYWPAIAAALDSATPQEGFASDNAAWEALSTYLDNELEPEAQESLELLLQQDASLAQRLGLLQDQQVLLRQSWNRLEAACRFDCSDAVMAALDSTDNDAVAPENNLTLAELELLSAGHDDALSELQVRQLLRLLESKPEAAHQQHRLSQLSYALSQYTPALEAVAEQQLFSEEAIAAMVDQAWEQQTTAPAVASLEVARAERTFTTAVYADKAPQKGTFWQHAGWSRWGSHVAACFVGILMTGLLFTGLNSLSPNSAPQQGQLAQMGSGTINNPDFAPWQVDNTLTLPNDGQAPSLPVDNGFENEPRQPGTYGSWGSSGIPSSEEFLMTAQQGRVSDDEMVLLLNL